MTAAGTGPDQDQLARLLKEAGSALGPEGVAALIAGVLAAPPEIGTSWHSLVADPTPPALAEALVLGAKGGLAPAVLLDLLKDSAAASKMVDIRGPLMVSHRFDAQMKVELFLKDFKLMLEEGHRLGVSLPLTSITQQLATATVAAGRGEEDLAAIITTLEQLAGLQEHPEMKKN